jgi:hypothetical protein
VRVVPTDTNYPTVASMVQVGVLVLACVRVFLEEALV